MERPIYTYRGRVKIGLNIVFSWTAVWPGGKISFLNDKIVAKAFPFKKIIPYSKIKKLEWSTAGYIKIIHEAGGCPFVGFYLLTGKNSPELTKIYKILKDKGISLKEY